MKVFKAHGVLIHPYEKIGLTDHYLTEDDIYETLMRSPMKVPVTSSHDSSPGFENVIGHATFGLTSDDAITVTITFNEVHAKEYEDALSVDEIRRKLRLGFMMRYEGSLCNPAKHDKSYICKIFLEEQALGGTIDRFGMEEV